MRRDAIIACLALGLCPAASAGEAPVAVSPGDPEKLLRVEARCPSFSWGTTETAAGYELVVYRVGPGGAWTEPVLRERFARSVSGWTPSLERCLERGARYAWTVRAVGRRGSSDWSRPNLFEVAAIPSAAELAEALADVLGSAGESGHSDEPGTLEAPAPIASAPQLRPRRRAVAASQAPPSSLLSPGDAALRADAGTARPYGLVGTTDRSAGEGETVAGVYGEQTNAASGGGFGVWGVAQAEGAGVLGTNLYQGSEHSVLSHGVGVLGESVHEPDGIGVSGFGSVGVLGQGHMWGGFFEPVGFEGNLLGAGSSPSSPVFTVDRDGKVFASAIDLGAFTITTQSAPSATSATCPAGSLRTGGGCNCGAVGVIVSAPNSTNSWNCQCEGATLPTSSFAVCLTSP